MAGHKGETAQQTVNRVLDAVVWDFEHELGYLHAYDPRFCQDERVAKHVGAQLDVHMLGLVPSTLKRMVAKWRETQVATKA